MTLDVSILQRIVTELAEDSSPNRIERLRQSIQDVRFDINEKAKRVKEITDRVSDVDDLIAGLNGERNDPQCQLLIKALRERKERLEVEASQINLGRMVGKLGDLEKQLEELDWNMRVVNQLKERLHG